MDRYRVLRIRRIPNSAAFFFFSAEVKQGNSLLQTSSLDLDSVHITKFTCIKLCLVNKRTPPHVFSHELVCNQPSVLVSTHMLPKGSMLNPFSVFSHELVCHLFSYQLHDQREVFNSKTKAQTLAIVCVLDSLQSACVLVDIIAEDHSGTLQARFVRAFILSHYTLF